MASFKLCKNSNKKGSTLLTVVVVSCFAAILIAAVLGFVGRAHKNAYINYNSEQAYYIATSALDSIHDYLEKDGSDYTTLLEMAQANGGKGSDATVKIGDLTIDDVIPGGECKVNVSYMGTAYIKVAVTGECNGQSKTVNAYYSVITNSVPAQIDNAIYADANISFSLSAENAGSVTSSGDYETSNNAKSSGSVITDSDFVVRTAYTWTDDPDGCGSFIVVGKNFLNENSGTTFYPSYSKVLEQNTSEFITVEGAFMPRQSMSIGTAPKVMDVYANSVYLGGAKNTNAYYADYVSALQGIGKSDFNTNSMSLTMFGNMYCYKMENATDPNYGHADDGDFIINNDATSLNLTGDLYVEGDVVAMTNHEVRIKGTLYLSDTSVITTMNNRGVICDAISFSTNTPEKVRQLIADNKVRIPEVAGGTDYYTVAEFEALMDSTDDADKERLAQIVKTDAIVHTVSNSRSYKPSTDYNDYKREYETTAEFVENDNKIKNLYQNALITTTNKISDFATTLADTGNTGTGLTFDYVIDQSYCLINKDQIDSLMGKNILVDMTKFNGDCVIVVDTNKQERSLKNLNIVVKNQVKDANGDITTKAEGFCYIILAYDNDTSTTSKLNLDKVNIFDYCTYKNVIKDGKAVNLTSYVGADDEVINDIYTDKVYTPNLGRIYLMINEGDKISFPQDTASNLCEAILYAPGVDVESEGCGHSGLKYLFDATKPDVVSSFSNGKRVCFLGAMICESFKDSRNTFGVAFSAPAPGSGVGASGSESATEVSFSHYESR